MATITGQNSYWRWKQIHWVQQELFNRGQAASSNLKPWPDTYLRIQTLPSKPNKGQRSLVQGQTPTITSYAGSPTQLLPKPVCLQIQLWTRWKGKLTINNLYCFSHWDRFFIVTFILTITMTCRHHYAYWITEEIGKSMAPAQAYTAQFQKACSFHTIILLPPTLSYSYFPHYHTPTSRWTLSRSLAVLGLSDFHGSSWSQALNVSNSCSSLPRMLEVNWCPNQARSNHWFPGQQGQAASLHLS